jgi:hypothetical protein
MTMRGMQVMCNKLTMENILWIKIMQPFCVQYMLHENWIWISVSICMDTFLAKEAYEIIMLSVCVPLPFNF